MAHPTQSCLPFEMLFSFSVSAQGLIPPAHSTPHAGFNPEENIPRRVRGASRNRGEGSVGSSALLRLQAVLVLTHTPVLLPTGCPLQVSMVERLLLALSLALKRSWQQLAPSSSPCHCRLWGFEGHHSTSEGHHSTSEGHQPTQPNNLLLLTSSPSPCHHQLWVPGARGALPTPALSLVARNPLPVAIWPWLVMSVAKMWLCGQGIGHFQHLPLFVPLGVLLPLLLILLIPGVPACGWGRLGRTGGRWWEPPWLL